MVSPINSYSISKNYLMQSMFAAKPADSLNSMNNVLQMQAAAKSKVFNQAPSGVTTGAKDVLANYSNLNKEAGDLVTDRAGNSFEKRAVDVGNSKALSATAANGVKIGTANSVEVNQVAKAQQNAGSWVDANSKWGATDQKYSMEIQSSAKGAKAVTVDFTAKAGETNKQVLERAANAITSSGAATAKVETKMVNGKEQAQLSITANKTGIEASFTVKDTAGNFAAAANVTGATTAAQDAQYKVNGKAYTSQSNDIKLENGKVAVTLKGTTKPGESVNLKVTPDAAGVVKDVKEFADAYNKSIKSLKDNGEFVNEKILDISKFASQDKARLEKAGVTVNADGTLKVDEKKLEAALKTDYNSTKSAIGGLADKVAEKTSVITNTPPSTFANQNFFKFYKAGNLFDIIA